MGEFIPIYRLENIILLFIPVNIWNLLSEDQKDKIRDMVFNELKK